MQSVLVAVILTTFCLFKPSFHLQKTSIHCGFGFHLKIFTRNIISENITQHDVHYDELSFIKKRMCDGIKTDDSFHDWWQLVFFIFMKCGMGVNHMMWMKNSLKYGLVWS